ncbi:MAG: GNAT family N-acetyltransferase [Cellvibrionales bacterium]|nr:MAG: GNAT family N-acetyltransferase [Cellvibrionales bacterium]
MSVPTQPQISICSVRLQDAEQVRELLLEYADTLALPSLQADLLAEAAEHGQVYTAPRGTLLLAWVDDLLAGSCGMRPLDDSDHIGAVEMRRLYVRPAFRGLGLGKQLAEAALDFARSQGYSCVLLDTLDTQESARQLYADLDFYEIDPYYHSPLAGAHYLKRDL